MNAAGRDPFRPGKVPKVSSSPLFSTIRAPHRDIPVVPELACVRKYDGFIETGWRSQCVIEVLRLGRGAHRGGGEAWAHPPPGTEVARYVYFSFLTLTTLGHDDIVPKTVDPSGLVVAEAVVVQLYLTVLIARLVGLHLSGGDVGVD